MKQRGWPEAILPAIIVVYGISYVAQTHHLPWNAILYPYALLGMIALLLGLVALRRRAGGDRPETIPGEPPPAQAGRRPSRQWIGGGIATAGRGLSVVGCTFVYPLIMESLGFVLTTTLYLAVLFQVFHAFRPAVIGPLALAISLTLSVFLLHVLDLNLPAFGFAELPFGI